MTGEEKLYHDVRERLFVALAGIHNAVDAGLEKDFALAIYHRCTAEHECYKWMLERMGHNVDIDSRLLTSAGDLIGYCYDPVYLRIDGEELVDLEAGVDKTGHFLPGTK